MTDGATGREWNQLRAAIEDCYARGWTDGHPVIPPTEQEVAVMVAFAGRDPNEVLGEVPPRRGVATVETVAASSVMAGCLPEHFPVVLAAVEAVLEPSFNLNGIQSTGNGATPLCIVSGPIVDQLQMNYGTNLFGYGSRANATIGRAIRLVLLLQGGAQPDLGTKSAMGNPARFSFCIAEAPSAPGSGWDNPWGPIHSHLGLRDARDGVTMIGANAPVNVWAGPIGYERDAFLGALAEEIAKLAVVSPVTQLTLVINPYAAQALHADPGWDRDEFRRQLFERAHAARLRLATVLPFTGDLDHWFADAESIAVVVAGGVHFPTACALLTGWVMGGGWAVTKALG